MSFSLEVTDMDLGDTSIENIFINDYMPMANGTYVKVYLLGFKYAADRDKNMEVDNTVIAKHLQIPLEDVFAAWDFWQDKGIIEKYDQENKHKYKVRFLSLKQLYINNNYGLKEEGKPKEQAKRDITIQDVLEANGLPRINEMFNKVDYILRRPTQASEKRRILSWIEDYNMDPDLIELAFSYALEEKKVSRSGAFNYVNGILKNWYDDGLTSLEQVVESFEEDRSRYYNYNKILKALGILGRGVSEGERKIIDQWFDQYNYDLDIILKACENSSRTSNPNINYINSIIKSWHEKGLKSLEDIEGQNKEYRQEEAKKHQAKSSRPVNTRTKFHNFDQKYDKKSDEELEDMFKKKREEYIKSLKGEA